MRNIPPHINNGKCERCKVIIEKYPGFSPELRAWFETFQVNHKDAHVSCAGRGKAEQEQWFRQGKSKAHWKQSAHNWNAALDFFRLTVNGADFSTSWYVQLLGPEAKKAGFDWAGDWKTFKELLHVQVKDFDKLAKEGKLKLVE
jgi:hypothetical protein